MNRQGQQTPLRHCPSIRGLPITRAIGSILVPASPLRPSIHIGHRSLVGLGWRHHRGPSFTEEQTLRQRDDWPRGTVNRTYACEHTRLVTGQEAVLGHSWKIVRAPLRNV
ncbi:hypothetical protein ACFQL7_09690 [Halocatena marina]|uniref:Uncharacterized protein n=1 Tax=Halocatena marina TaxID=2934937 RepID=A0ABD5YS95_9EURY